MRVGQILFPKNVFQGVNLLQVSLTVLSDTRIRIKENLWNAKMLKLSQSFPNNELKSCRQFCTHL